MIVIRSGPEVEPIELGNVNYGACIKFPKGRQLYIMTSHKHDGRIMIVNLEHGNVFWYFPDTKVLVVYAEIHMDDY